MYKYGVVCWVLFFILVSKVSYAQPMLHDLLEDKVEKKTNNQQIFRSGRAVTFKQTSGDAAKISKITMSYFVSNDCSGHIAGTYTTPDGTSFELNANHSFGLMAGAVWELGYKKLSIPNMSGIKSIAVVLRSTNQNTPQANFTGSVCGGNPSLCCIPVTCASGECFSGLEEQNFTLNQITNIGEPADGGVIACLISEGGVSNLVAAIEESEALFSWSASQKEVNASSLVDGAENTRAIVNTLVAAGHCNTYTATGNYIDWFLPAVNQLGCLYQNRLGIGGFESDKYWSSSEKNLTEAIGKHFLNGENFFANKYEAYRVRCVRAFAP